MNIMGLCGDNCSFCPRYLATQNGNIAELEKVKELWVRLGLRELEFPVQEMTCHGCKPENRCAYTELRTCVREKGLENCGLCNDYPCEVINRVFDKSEKLRSHANHVCSQTEIDLLHKAFFSKKEYFDSIHP